MIYNVQSLHLRIYTSGTRSASYGQQRELKNYLSPSRDVRPLLATGSREGGLIGSIWEAHLTYNNVTTSLPACLGSDALTLWDIGMMLWYMGKTSKVNLASTM